MNYKFSKPIPVHTEGEIQVDHAELLAQQDALHIEMNQLRQHQQTLEREHQQLLQAKEEFQMHIHEQMGQMESSAYAVLKGATRTAYEWTELLCNNLFN